MRSLGDRTFYDRLDEMIAPGHVAVLVIDMQNDYTHPDGYYARIGLDLTLLRETIEPIGRLASAARAHNVPVLYSQHTILPGYVSDSPLWLGIHAAGSLTSLDQTDFYTIDGTWGHEIVDELEPHPGDVVFKKFRSNCFVGTGLETMLKSLGIQTLVVTGQVTHGCVENTVRLARDLDYYAVMVADGVAAIDKANHDATFFNLGKRLPCPQADEVVRCWEATARQDAPARSTA